jgi:lysophospholipase L1-like esterase
MAKRKGAAFHGGRAIFFVILVFLAFITTLAYQEIIKPAANNPARFVTGHLHRPGRKIVVCAGASIIRGQVSFNIGDYLTQKTELQDFQFVNAGINGDLAYNLLQRLDPIIACKPNYIVVLIGTDDLLGALYPNMYEYYKWTKQLPRKPDIAWYAENLQRIVEILKQKTKAKIALVSLPMMGEAVYSVANHEVIKYNEAIKSVATEEQVGFLAIFDQQIQYLRENQRSSGPEYTENSKQMVWAMVDHMVFKKSLDAISIANGYLLHTDGIHLNTNGGKIIANQMETFLKQQ